MKEVLESMGHFKAWVPPVGSGGTHARFLFHFSQYQWVMIYFFRYSPQRNPRPALEQHQNHFGDGERSFGIYGAL